MRISDWSSDVCSSDLLESRRRLVHAELARLLEQRHGAMEPARELSLRITQHWRGAGDAGRAGLWGVVAARWLSVRNFVTAIDQCRTAIADQNRARRHEPQLRPPRALARPTLSPPRPCASDAPRQVAGGCAPARPHRP